MSSNTAGSGQPSRDLLSRPFLLYNTAPSSGSPVGFSSCMVSSVGLYLGSNQVLLVSRRFLFCPEGCYGRSAHFFPAVRFVKSPLSHAERNL